VTYLALVLYFSTRHHLYIALAVVMALIGSLMTSYFMALGKAYNLNFRIGILRRQDRVTLISAGLLLSLVNDPIARFISGHAEYFILKPDTMPNIPLALVIYILAVLSNVTALQRFLLLLKLSRSPGPAGMGGIVSEIEREPSLRSKQLKILHETIGNHRSPE
jgi:phosphatidylglycerophosphate synthase